MSTVEHLQGRMTQPRSVLVEELATLEGDILVLGANGKMGPTLTELAVNARRSSGAAGSVIAVSRFSEPGSAERLQEIGARTVVADLASERDLQELPDAPNVVYLVGAKFGTTGQEHQTWATNTYLPGRVAERYAGSRIVGLSTGNVYPFTPVESGGATEETIPDPVGDYAMSCLGRERILTHFATRNDSPLALIRLNYAVESRYGVLLDIATSVFQGNEVDVTMGYVNVVWQGYANEVILRCLTRADLPPFIVNLTGLETLSVRSLATRFGELFDRPARLIGEEAPTALLANASRCHDIFGDPKVDLDELLVEIADWLRGGGATLGKPTHFATRDGKF